MRRYGFGQVRNNTRSLESYSLAAGNVGTIEARIVELNGLISAELAIQAAQQAIINQTAQDLAANQARLGILNSDWNSICTWSMSASKCAEKRDPIMAQIVAKQAERSAITVRRAAANTVYQNSRTKVASYQEELSSALAEKEALAQATLTLAGQGTTPEQIRIEAQANAQAIVNQAKVQADMAQKAQDQNLAAAERKSKSRKVVILSFVMLALVIVGFMAFRKIKSKKNGKTK